ncbi:hypothetical protein C9J21_20005 [Photobacterium phosphoreum]|uniref:hypothetical protein n=1 Tax=Photobacterium phosphoreum TaxID=659 RepID=UPI000D1669B4|nr:hypothetical protein [Photobacterium phosphoreum]PSW29173.1 hypothetical protein C9J21_20005 [Photobacterium phosphoreum]
MNTPNIKQFALMDVSNKNASKKIYSLFSAGEIEYFSNNSSDSISYPSNEDGYVLNICYGRFIVNKTIMVNINTDNIKRIIASSIDKWLVALNEDNTYWLGIKDIELMTNELTYKCSCGCKEKSSPVFDLAFAALISSPSGLEDLTNKSIYDECGDIDLLDKFKTEQYLPSSLPAAVKYDDFTLYENTIKRAGIFALGYTMPKNDDLSIENWKNNINSADILAVATLIK